MADFGIKIAKAGKSIQSTSQADYVYWSKYPSRTILMSGETTIFCPNGATTTLTITHNLGYIPQVALYSDNSFGFQLKLPWDLSNSSTGYIEATTIVRVFTDRIEIRFNRFLTGADFTYTVKYLIYMERIL